MIAQNGRMCAKARKAASLEMRDPFSFILVLSKRGADAAGSSVVSAEWPEGPRPLARRRQAEFERSAFIVEALPAGRLSLARGAALQVKKTSRQRIVIGKREPVTDR